LLSQIDSQSSSPPPLQGNIIKRASWSPCTFYKVDWDAHEKAYHRHNRLHSIDITKLACGLNQTKCQDYKYSGTTSTCPCRLTSIQILPNMLRFPEANRLKNCTLATEKFQQSLEKLSTPGSLIEAFIHGLKELEIYLHP
jgi:hypothetical protein